MLVLSLLAVPAWGSEAYEVRRGDRIDRAREDRIPKIMAMSEADLLALVPESGGIYFTECPHCEADTQDRGNFAWSPDQPRQLKCTRCGMVFPNAKYPADKTLVIGTPDGELHFDYHTRPDGYRLYFDAHADYHAREYMEESARYLAESYRLTGNDEHARRAALILIRFTERYRAYPYIYDMPFRQKIIQPYNKPEMPGVPPYRVSHFSWWAYMDISENLLATYDLLGDYAPLDAMAGGKAPQMIEQDLLGHMVEWVISIEETYSNMSPGMWSDFINAGNVLGEPGFVLEALERVERFLEKDFRNDGFWKEPAVSYHRQVAGNLARVRNALERYNVSADVDPETRRRITSGVEGLTRAVEQMYETLGNIALPNGQNPPINDTWSRGRSRQGELNDSMLLPGVRLAILRAGDDEHEIYAWLNNAGRGHHHDDPLDIGLFAFGHELLRDIGYTHTGWRMWSNSTMSHNTVIVDGVKAETVESRQRMRLFWSDGDTFHIAEADDDGAYPVTKRYRRTLVLVGDRAEDGYLIDVFQVRGGSQHDYLLHGSAAEDSTARIIGATLSPFDGTLMNDGVAFERPTSENDRGSPGEPYGFVQELRAGRVASDVTWDMRLRGQPTIGVRTYVVWPTDGTIYTGVAPRIRQAERQDSQLPRFTAPFFAFRRNGEDLQSTFVAVHEPINGEPRDRTISGRVADGVIVVEVDDETFTMTDGMWRLSRGNETIQIGGDGATWDGEVLGFARTRAGGWFDVPASIAPQTSLSAVLVTLPDQTVRAYNVARIEPKNGGTRLHVLEDPAMRIGGGKIKLTSSPQRTIDGDKLRYAVYAAKRSKERLPLVPVSAETAATNSP